MPPAAGASTTISGAGKLCAKEWESDTHVSLCKLIGVEVCTGIWHILLCMDELAGLPESVRKLALDRFRLLQPHLEEDRSLRLVATRQEYRIVRPTVGDAIQAFRSGCAGAKETGGQRRTPCRFAEDQTGHRRPCFAEAAAADCRAAAR